MQKIGWNVCLNSAFRVDEEKQLFFYISKVK